MIWPTPPRRSSTPCRRQPDVRPDRRQHQGHLPGFHGRPGDLPLRAGHRLRHRMVGGVTPGKGGESHLGLPVFDTVRAARDATDCDASVIYVPAPFAADAILEAVDAEVPLIVCITEGIPVMDMVKVKRALGGSKSRL